MSLWKPLSASRPGWLALLSAAALLAGCADASGEWTRVRAKADVGVPDEQVLVIAEQEYVCPHLVPISRKEYSPQDIRDGEVFGHFGPFVPCLTPVTQASGLCPTCNQPYHLPGSQPLRVDVNMQAPALGLRVSPNIYIKRGGDKVFPHAVEGVPYVHGLAAVGGGGQREQERGSTVTELDRWSVRGSLPPGLRIEKQTSTPVEVNVRQNPGQEPARFRKVTKQYEATVISGVPQRSGTFNFTLTVTDSNGSSADEQFTLRVLSLDDDDRLSDSERNAEIGPQEPLLSEEASSVEQELGAAEGWPSAEALVVFKCPYDQQPLDPVAWQVAEGDARTSQRFAPGHCPSCQRWFQCLPSDLLTTLDHYEQLQDASGNPIDPNYHASSGPGVTDGRVNLVQDFIGVCWRCSGLKLCPECDGAGVGNSGIYGDDLPTDCWNCGDTGRCPECDSQGFYTYTGSLPADYKMWSKTREQTTWLPSDKRDFRHGDAAADGEQPAGQPAQ